MTDFINTPMPMTEAKRFFLNKKKRGFTSYSYLDVEPETHAIAFTVAKTTAANVLDVLFTGLSETINNNGTYNDFKQSVQAELKKQGWWKHSRHTRQSPSGGLRADGVRSKKNSGSPIRSDNRLRTIFNTNIRTAFAAGEWAEIQKLQDSGDPVYIRYVATLDGKARASHADKHDIIRPASDDFWNDWFPPNGWRCRCQTIKYLKSTLDARGLRVSPKQFIQKYPYTNPRTGTTRPVARGIDPSFSYNVGKAWMRPYTLEMGKFEVIGNAPRVRQYFQKPNYDLLPTGKSDTYYALAFLRKFGIRNLNEITTFTDKTGLDILISKELLTDNVGNLKAGKEGRGKYMNLLADTLKDPDRIEKYLNKDKRVRRRYIKDLTQGKKKIGFALFEWDFKDKVWIGQTVFNPTQRYYNKQPKGKVIYEKNK